MTPLAKNLGRIQGNLFSGLLERARLQVQLALGTKLDKDIAALKDKYDGSDITDLESQVSAISDQKEDLATKAQNLTDSLNRSASIRESVDELRGLAEATFFDNFDDSIDVMNRNAGSAIMRPGNYVGNAGTVGSHAEVVKVGGITTTINKTFLGTGYYITLNDGTIMHPDFKAKTLSGIAFSDLTLDSLSGDAIQFNDGVTTYTGTLTRSGTGILSAWMYNNFATQADIDNATGDTSAAMKKIDHTEQAFRGNLSFISTNVSNLDDDITALNDKVKSTAQSDLDALQAEEKALQTRFDLAMTSLSLTAKINTDFIQSIFMAPDPTAKQNVFDAISGSIR